MKVSVFRVSAEGEQVNVELHVPDKVLMLAREGHPDALDQYLAPAFRVVDARLIEMNRRIIAAKAVVSQYSPEVRAAVSEVVDIIHGNVPDAQLKALLRQAEERGAVVTPAPRPEPQVTGIEAAGEIVPE